MELSNQQTLEKLELMEHLESILSIRLIQRNQLKEKEKTHLIRKIHSSKNFFEKKVILIITSELEMYRIL